MCDVEDVCVDDFCYVCEDLGEVIGVVLFVDVFDVVLVLFFGYCVVDVVDVEVQGFGQVVEILQVQMGKWFYYGNFLWLYGGQQQRWVSDKGFCWMVWYENNQFL